MNPDEAAFLAALAADPKDETARLVFADWLDDRGDPRGRLARDPLYWPMIRPDPANPVPLLLEALRGGNNTWVRQAAVEALARLGPAAAAALPDLLALLGDPDPHIRTRVPGTLAGIAGQDAAPVFVRLLGSDDRNLRVAALDGLRILRTGPAAELVRLSLGDPDRIVRERAAATLRVLNPNPEDLHPELAAALRSEDWRVRLRVLRTLTEIGSPGAAELARECLPDPHPEVRRRVVGALCAQPTASADTAVALARSALTEEEPGWRVHITRALQRFGPTAITAARETYRAAFDDPSAAVRTRAVELMLGLGVDAATVAECVRVATTDPDPEVRAAATRCVCELTAPAVPADDLARNLADPDPAVRDTTARFLGRSGSLHVVNLVAPLVADPHVQVRMGAVDALGRACTPEASAAAAETPAVFLTDTAPGPRTAAAAALAQVDAGRVVPALLRAAEDEEYGVRRGVAAALGRAKPAAERRVVIEALVRLLRDPVHLVRESAAAAVAEFGPDAAFAAPDLVRTLDDEVRSVRAAGLAALTRLGPAARGVASDLVGHAIRISNTEVRGQLIKALRAIGPEAVGPGDLVRLWRTAGWPNRPLAAELLGRLGPGAAAAVPDIIAEMRADTNWYVHREAIDVLTRIGPGAAAAVPELIEALRHPVDPEIRRGAADALRAIGPQAVADAVARLAGWLNDPNPVACAAAREALGRLGRPVSPAPHPGGS